MAIFQKVRYTDRNESGIDERLRDRMSGCTLCPRMCEADRENGKTGFCGETGEIRAARAALHMWEEPCISGKEGSGTVFFTGCTLRCVFCQNHEIAGSKVGKVISEERLAEIIRALQSAKEQGMYLPVVYNTGGYERVETLKMLDGLVDIYLPDFKYLNTDHAKKYSMAEDYPEVVKAALAEMVRQAGKPVFDERGMMKRGVIVRHLLLPGCLADGKRVVKYLHETYGNRIYMSLMSQYTPLESLDAVKYPELNRKVPEYAYEKMVDYAISLGVMQAFIQEGDTAKESFIPPFTLEGV